MFDLLSHNRAMMNFHTELLEVCDWCETEMERVLITAAKVFDEVRLPDIPCPLDHYINKVIKPALIEENLFENQADIIIKFIKHDAKFVEWMMGPEEN